MSDVKNGTEVCIRCGWVGVQTPFIDSLDTHCPKCSYEMYEIGPYGNGEISWKDMKLSLTLVAVGVDRAPMTVPSFIKYLRNRHSIGGWLSNMRADVLDALQQMDKRMIALRMENAELRMDLDALTGRKSEGLGLNKTI